MRKITKWLCSVLLVAAIGPDRMWTETEDGKYGREIQ